MLPGVSSELIKEVLITRQVLELIALPCRQAEVLYKFILPLAEHLHLMQVSIDIGYKFLKPALTNNTQRCLAGSSRNVLCFRIRMNVRIPDQSDPALTLKSVQGDLTNRGLASVLVGFKNRAVRTDLDSYGIRRNSDLVGKPWTILITPHEFSIIVQGESAVSRVDRWHGFVPWAFDLKKPFSNDCNIQLLVGLEKLASVGLDLNYWLALTVQKMGAFRQITVDV